MELLIWRSVSSLETAPMWVSPTHLQLLINVNRNAALQRNGMEIAMFLPLASCMFLGNSQRLSYTL